MNSASSFSPRGRNVKLVAFCIAFFLSHVVSAQRTTQLFNDNWRFFKGDAVDAKNASFNDASWRQVDLPHDWSIEGPFSDQWASATGYLPGGVGWYRKTFEISPALRSKKIFIYFDGVYKNSEVWINGHYLGKRPNGYVSFQYEITQHLNKTGKNTIAVKADHTDFADSRWYTGSGIYRNVYLVATDPVHVDLWGVKFSTPKVSAASATAVVTVKVVNQNSSSSPVIIKAQLADAKGKVVATAQKQIAVAANYKGDATLSFSVLKPSLWSVENPALYKLNVSILKQGKKTDEVTDEVGFRWFSFDKDKGFFLNGKAMKLKGVCIHDDAGALGVAVPEEVWVRRLKTLKEAGCNSIRMSHNPHADYLYKLMDRMGFLVMDEAFDEWEEGKNKWIKGWNVGQPGKEGTHSFFKEWAEQDVRDMVLRNINRPSIIMWSIGNEIDYPNDPYSHEVLNTGRNPQIYGRGFLADHPPASRLGEIAKGLTAIVKQYDTTRPVTAALAGVVMSNETIFPEQLDVVGYNYQEYRYPDDHIKYPARVIYGSENGHQYTAWKAVADNDYISGQYLWTGIDYLGEARAWPSRSNGAGLMDLAGFPKSEYYFRQSLWVEKPMIYIGTSTGAARNQNNRRNIFPSWNYKQGDSVKISCFTNCEEAEVFLNGQSLGRKKMTDAKERVISWDAIYQPGEIAVKGYNQNKEAAGHAVKTSGEVYSIKALADRTTLSRSKKELSHIEIMLTDKNGLPVFNADNEVSLTIEGPAKLLGLESGSSVSHEDYKSNKRKAFNGKLLAYVQSQQKPGLIKVTITSAGLQSQIIEFR
ncbi:MAG TPA: glycoside hydrolase family 2 TIM barrel-domain containing protein [Flavisolibacter sp.]